MKAHLLDLSACQPDSRIDWQAVALATIDGEPIVGIIVKATDGNGGTDPDFVHHVRGIRSVDQLRITHGFKPFAVGAYHFAHPDRMQHDAENEAEHFIAVAGTELDFYALDLEEARSIDNGVPFIEWALTFCDTVESATWRRTLSYGGGPFFTEHAAGKVDAYAARLLRLPLWLAAYVADPTRYIPKPWTTWTMHQRSGDQAPYGEKTLHVPGIDGGRVNVDHSVFNGTPDDFYAWIKTLCVPKPHEAGLVLGNDGPAHDPYWVDRMAATLADDPDDPSETVTSPGTPTAKSNPALRAVNAPILKDQ